MINACAHAQAKLANRDTVLTLAQSNLLAPAIEREKVRNFAKWQTEVDNQNKSDERKPEQVMLSDLLWVGMMLT